MVPAAVIAASGGGRLRIGRLLGGLAQAPGEIAALIRLSARYRIASQVLTTLAAAGTPTRRALMAGPGGALAAAPAEGS